MTTKPKDQKKKTRKIHCFADPTKVLDVIYFWGSPANLQHSPLYHVESVGPDSSRDTWDHGFVSSKTLAFFFHFSFSFFFFFTFSLSPFLFFSSFFLF